MSQGLNKGEFRHGRRHSAAVRIVVFLLAILVGGLYFGCLFASTVAGITDTGAPIDVAILPEPLSQVMEAPTPIEARATPTSAPTATPTATPTTTPTRAGLPLPKDRVSILLLGVDQRDDERRAGVPSRSDTLVVVTADPVAKTGGVLSIPRDLWVSIPGGYQNNKINVAHFLGEMNKLPGGGPGLAKRTIEANFGIPTQYYVRANFRGFEMIIDALGGIDIDVPIHIIDRQYPTEDYGYITVEFFPGLQHMDGVRALQYARTRHDTDIPIFAMPGLLELAAETDSANINTVAIDQTMVYERYAGSTDLVPRPGEIQKAVARLMADPKVSQEKAKVVLENGTGQGGLATKMRDYIERAGYVVAGVDRAPNADYAETTILDHSGTKRATLAGLAQLLKVRPDDILLDQSGEDADITIILGADAAGL